MKPGGTRSIWPLSVFIKPLLFRAALKAGSGYARAASLQDRVILRDVCPHCPLAAVNGAGLEGWEL